MSIFGHPSVAVNLATGKPLDKVVQPHLALCTTPDKEGEPGLPVNIFKNGFFVREHRLDDPRHLWIQDFNSRRQNRYNGVWAEMPDERTPAQLTRMAADELVCWEPAADDAPISVAEVFETFAPLLGVRCCVAGGAVRDELLGRTPKDYDIFCFGPFDERAILAVAQLVKMEAKRYGGRALSNCLTVKWRGVQLQFVHRGDGCHDVDSLLDGFDWSICLFAYDAGGYVKRYDLSKIGGKQELRLNPSMAARAMTPLRSLQRGFDFAKRFDMQINDCDLAALCAEVAEQYAATHCDLPTTQEIIGG